MNAGGTRQVAPRHAYSSGQPGTPRTVRTFFWQVAMEWLRFLVLAMYSFRLLLRCYALRLLGYMRKDSLPTSSNVGVSIAVWTLVSAVWLGHAMDVLTTVYAILALDAREANPVMKIFAHNPFSIGAIKYYALRRIMPPVIEAAREGFVLPLFLHVVLIWAVVLWNCGVIVTKRRKRGSRPT